MAIEPVSKEHVMSLMENINRIRDQMNEAAIRSGRGPEEVLLCAACKARSSEEVKQSAELAIDVFGENRMQEMRLHQADNAYLGKPCHFIGHLQTNKVKQVVGQAQLIQSVGSTRLLAAINREAQRQGIVQDILLEINIGDEDSKFGIPVCELERMMDQAGHHENIRVLGLMTIPPPESTESAQRVHYSRMKGLFEKAKKWHAEKDMMQILSMGMSDSYVAAILEGSNLVRIGRSIYGERK